MALKVELKPGERILIGESRDHQRRPAHPLPGRGLRSDPARKETS